MHGGFQDMHQLSDNAMYIRQLTKELPLTSTNMPKGIFRPDLLPLHLYDEQMVEGYNASALMEALEEDNEKDDKQNLNPSQSPNLNPRMDLKELPVIRGKEGALIIMDDDVTSEETEEIVAPLYMGGFPVESLDAAYIPINYQEGFPSFNSGDPIWMLLPYETPQSYEYFQQYLSMLSGMDIAEDEQDEDESYIHDVDAPLNNNYHPVRSVQALGEIISAKIQGHGSESKPQELQEKLINMYHLHYWKFRAHAHDLFKIAQNRKSQELRAISMEDEHYTLAKRLRRQIQQFMTDDERFWDQLNPKLALDILGKAIALERISVGLPAGGPSLKEGPGTGGQSIEVLYRHLAITAEGGPKEIEGTVIEDGELLEHDLIEDANKIDVTALLRDMGKDPTKLRTIEELIIKAQTMGQS